MKTLKSLKVIAILMGIFVLLGLIACGLVSPDLMLPAWILENLSCRAFIIAWVMYFGGIGLCCLLTIISFNSEYKQDG